MKTKYVRTDRELPFLIRHETDSYSLWQACQELYRLELIRLIECILNGAQTEVSPEILETFEFLLRRNDISAGLRANIISVPTEIELVQELNSINIEAIYQARNCVVTTVASAFYEQLHTDYLEIEHRTRNVFDSENIERRMLSNRYLDFLCTEKTDRSLALLKQRLENSDTTMTNAFSALSQVCHWDHPYRQKALNDFYNKWSNNPQVIDSWFRAQALARNASALIEIEELTRHPDFTLQNPNRLRSLLGSFCKSNLILFHDSSGAGYRLCADNILKLDSINSQMAAALLRAFAHWKQYDSNRKSQMQEQLERIKALPALSRDTSEIVEKLL